MDRRLSGISDGASSLSNYFVAGSLFNRSDALLVSYPIDTANESIRFTTTRTVEPDEDLCVRYSQIEEESELADGGSSKLSSGEASNHVPSNVQPERDPDHLPFIGVKLTSDEDDEEAAETIRTSSTPARVF